MILDFSAWGRLFESGDAWKNSNWTDPENETYVEATSSDREQAKRKARAKLDRQQFPWEKSSQLSEPEPGRFLFQLVASRIAPAGNK